MSYGARFVGVCLLGVLALSGCRHASGSEPAGGAPRLLAVGSQIPDLTGTDQRGQVLRLASKVGHPCLVYFYPKDGTPGCTKEACAFRDVWQRFEQQGVALLGVSRDDSASHAQFAEAHHIPFPLIADTDGKWATAFGVPSNSGKSARVSFLFDASGKLAHVYPNVDPGVHATQVLSDVAATH